MDMHLSYMQNALQNALDQLLSSRSSSDSTARALDTLEQLLARVCLPSDNTDDLDTFLALQYTFEYNIPSRLLTWIAQSTTRLEVLTNKGSMDQGREHEASTQSSQLCLALSIMQGVALNHKPSKHFLGRRYALEILLDLLLASRHLSSMPFTPTQVNLPSTSSKPSAKPEPLSSVVLDTLLCVLVDSSTALRAFEEANGVQTVVKILKRAGTPREVRMKCLEFLYFYLLDETPTSRPPESSLFPMISTSLPPTAPSTPSQSHSRDEPTNPISHYNSSTFSFPSTAPSSPRSVSSSSTSSLSSITSYASASTTPSSLPSKPHTPPPVANPQPKSLMMLRKDVEFVPLSPKKAQVIGLGVSPRGPAGIRRGHVSGKSVSRSRLGMGEADGEQPNRNLNEKLELGAGRESEQDVRKENVCGDAEERRTTEEKKELLGTMLGNVDALVEGVRKAGIWGLG